MVQVPSARKQNTSDGHVQFLGTEKKLLEANISIMKNEERLKLLRHLMKGGLATRDIYSFTSKQARLRNGTKTPDNMTSKAAMIAKINDIKWLLKREYRTRTVLDRQLLDELDNKSRRLKAIYKKIKSTVGEKRKSIRTTYEKKISHYENKQVPAVVTYQSNVKKPTIPPKRLSKYQTLSIFGNKDSLPSKVPVKGPFICDPRISLTKGELELLSKDPKFSITSEPTDTEFKTEYERCLAKHRFNVNSEKNRKNQQQNCAIDLDDIDKDSDLEKLDRLYCMFNTCKDRYIYNPVKNSIRFSGRRATDYKHNKSIRLPKPLSNDQEFECEIRRRKYQETFDGYLKNVRRKKHAVEDNEGQVLSGKNIKSNKDIINLNKVQKEALKSLSKRIKDGEIYITSTDKSSRFALLNCEQYLAAGEAHTSKDIEISWDQVKYLQSQTNSHMWWLSRIVKYCKDGDEDRMNKNISSSSVEVPEMVILIKDHKHWTPEKGGVIPSRPVVSGSRGINTHLSEWLSEILEPIANNMRSGEVASTEEALSRFDNLNKEIDANLDTPHDDVLQGLSLNNKISKEQERRLKEWEAILDYDRIDKSDIDINKMGACDTNEHLLTVLDNLIVTGHGQRRVHEDSNMGEKADTGTFAFEKKNEKTDTGILAFDKMKEKDLTVTASGEDIIKTNFKDIMDEVMLIDKTEGDWLQTKMTNYFSKIRGENTYDKATHRKILKQNEKILRKKASRNKKFSDKLRDMFKAGTCWKEIDDEDIEKLINKNGIDDEIQDFNSKPVLLGGDVCALYPSLDQIGTAEIAAEAVMETPILFEDIDYDLLAVYILLNLGQVEMRALGLRDYIPEKLVDDNSNSLISRTNRNLLTWKFNQNEYPDHIKKIMLATMIKIATLTLMLTSCYTFGGRIFLQVSGTGIGLRGSACLARIVMNKWDQRMARVLTSWGLKAKFYIRYIDDLRLYIYPIKRGWHWTPDGWKFNAEDQGSECNIERTCSEFCKVFNMMQDFLNFTTESEVEFKNNYLPTLDVETQVEENGRIKYRFFSKPTNNNLLLENGTGLAQDTVFSSLRQEVVRRMVNTEKSVNIDERLQILEDFVQLMINSSHKFTFIKAVLLQGLTKYEHMLTRDGLQQHMVKHMPLHRPREFKRQERILNKYVNKMVWFSGENFGDLYKKDWKKFIKRKGSDKKKRMSPLPERKITTVFFVPQSRNSWLFKKLRQVEDFLRRDCEWGVKVLEQPGTPLLNKFVKKFPIIHGCPKGEECSICENKGVKCVPKSVVYIGTCKQCSHDVDDAVRAVYIGETARPWRDRIWEHFDKAKNLKPDSMIVQHWAEQHGTQSECPAFEFKILNKFKDPLRRQICEAICIQDQGTLNRKSEFNTNELCRLEARKHWRDMESQLKSEAESKTVFINKLQNFVDVMDNVLKNKNVVDNRTSCYRLKRPHQWSDKEEERERRPKTRKMNCSTPNTSTYRSKLELPDETSPISGRESLIADSVDSGESFEALIKEKSPTNMSDQLGVSRLTPIKQESSSMEKKKLMIATNNWTRAAVWAGIIRKTRSMPDLNISIGSNCLATKIGHETAHNAIDQGFRTRRRLFSLQDLGQESVGSIHEMVSRWSTKSNFEETPNDSTQSNVDAVGKILKPDVETPEKILNSNVETAGKILSSNVETVGKILSSITLGKDASGDILNQKATPCRSNIKRSLHLSPDTIMGSPLKYRIYDDKIKLDDQEVLNLGIN